jgi:hypothetical protein
MEIEYKVEVDDGRYECKAVVTFEEGDASVGVVDALYLTLAEYRYYDWNGDLVYGWVEAWIAPTELKPDHWLERCGQDYLPSLEEYADWERNQSY